MPSIFRRTLRHGAALATIKLSMAQQAAPRRHLYMDQQKPDEILSEAPVIQEMLSRRPPTPEDAYFQALELREKLESHRHLTLVKPPRPGDESGASEELPGGTRGLWPRIVRYIFRTMNTHWRPGP